MKRLFALLAAGLAGIASLPAATDNRSFNASPFVKLDGTVLSGVSSWSGGGLRARLAETSSTPGPKKHVANFAVDPIQIEAALPLDPLLLSHLAGLCNGQAPTATLVLGLLNANGGVIPGTQEASEAVLTEVVFPAVNATNRLPKAVLTFVPSQIVPTNSSPFSQTGSQRRNLAGFSLQLDNLVTAQVTSVGEIRISRTISSGSDSFNRTTASVSATQFANIVVTLRGIDSSWTAWRNDFLVQGNSQDGQEKTGHLNFLDSAGAVGFSLELRHVGLAAISVIPGEGGLQPTALEAELYVEQIVPDTPGSSSSSSNPSSSGSSSPNSASSGTASTPASGSTSTPPATGSTGNPPASTAPTSPAGTPSSTPATGGTGTASTTETKPGSTKDTATPTDKERKTLPVRETTIPVTTPDGGLKKADTSIPTDRSTPITGERTSKNSTFPAVKNAEDKGIRDPAGFPRAEGTVRKAYNLTKGKGFSQESASYTSSRPMEELAEFYEKAIAGDGWVEDRRWENNNGYGGTHQLIIKFTKEKDTYLITFTDTKPGEVTIEIRIDRVTA